MSTLFNRDNSDSDGELKINNDYATNYNNWRQKEELNKLKTKYGNLKTNSGSSEDDDSDDTSDDEEDEEELKQQFDKDFYKALAYLKNKDPKIYKEDVSFFTNSNKAQEDKVQKKKSGEKAEKEKAVFLRDYERKIIVERDGKFSDSEEEPIKKKPTSDKLTYVEEQQQLRDSFKKALQDDEAGDSLDLLKPKSKSQKEKEQEESDYKQWLKGQKAKLDEEEQKELKPLRDFWTNPNLDSNEKFLRDYILNNKYLEKDREDEDVGYEQMAHDSDDNLSEDEKNIEKQEEFEHKYNFRFEEPDRDFIKRFPRTMENSLRKKDTRRSQKRVEVKQRKEEEKLRKKEELKQLKALKRKEIEEKIEKLKEITGNDDLQFNSVDLDGDFDPNEYDRKMTELFNDEFYAAPEGDVKPEFPDIDQELEIERTWDNYDPTNATCLQEDFEEPHCEDGDFNMDADYDEARAQQELIESTRKRKGRKRSKFAELISKEKPKFDPAQYQSYKEYFDKYYSLDYEDMIGDLPCRFKYRKVVPNDYGLSVEEILTADDKELNKWCSLKKALQYKPEHVELNEIRTYKQKAKDDAAKRRILRSLYSAQADAENEAQDAAPGKSSNQEESAPARKKRRGNKKKATLSNGDVTEPKVEPQQQANATEKRKAEANEDSPKKKRKRDKSQKVEDKKQEGSSESNSRLTTEKADGATTEESPKLSKEPVKKNKSKKKFNKKQKNSGKFSGKQKTEDVLPLDPQRLKTYGINPKKLKKKLKYGGLKA